MSFFASLLNRLSTLSTESSACYFLLWDEPEAPKSVIEK